MNNFINQFQTYANSFGQGYLKDYKAISMVETLRDMPDIIDDYSGFLFFLKSSLEMEGFNSGDIELIMGWLYERKDFFN